MVTRRAGQAILNPGLECLQLFGNAPAWLRVPSGPGSVTLAKSVSVPSRDGNGAVSFPVVPRTCTRPQDFRPWLQRLEPELSYWGGGSEKENRCRSRPAGWRGKVS